MVDRNEGITIVPEMMGQYLRPEQKANLRSFSDPPPVREIIMVTRKDFIRNRIVTAFHAQAKAVLPAIMTSKELRTNIVKSYRDSIPFRRDSIPP